MFRDTNHLEVIANKIGMPCETFQTSGIGYGLLIRYKTFYLSAYDVMDADAFRIRGFRYDEEKPVFDVSVPRDELEKFTSQINKDDYLKDPISITWSAPTSLGGPRIY